MDIDDCWTVFRAIDDNRFASGRLFRLHHGNNVH